ncbi:MCE family protein [candidate division WOR-3 bacterium]|jgi:phospholipid/cholesterol/gamma-HCH transport system substrate-binding protein|nr:MCE family protein [candidate division WOR-3 bacterium]
MNKMNFVKVGTFIFFTIIILAIGLLWMNDVSFKRNYYKINCYFDNVYRLRKGDPIYIRGLKEGTVGSVFIDGDSVKVIMLVSNKVKLKKDMKITLINTTVIAENKYIEIYPGKSNELYDLSKPAHGSYTGLDQIFILFEKIKNVFNEMGDISSNNVNILNNLNSVIAQTDSIMSENRKNIEITTKNIKESTKSIDSLMGNLIVITEELKDLSVKLNSDNNSISKLSSSDSLYTETMKTIGNLNDLISDIKENPSKYIDINLIRIGNGKK